MQKIRDLVQRSIDVKSAVLKDDALVASIQKAADLIISSLNKKKRIYFCGNGGSAADAQHLAAELSGRFYTDRKALPAEALHCNSSYITAVANDYSYDVVYARLVEGICEEGDVLVGLSTSGNSSNIIKAFETARAKGVATIALTGESGGKLKALSDCLINVPSTDTPRIQEVHILAGHIICQLTEESLFP